MKKLILIAVASFFWAGAYAQTQAPANWSYASKTLNCTEEAVSLKASLRSGWHINSLHVGSVSPVKTSFEFKPSSVYDVKDVASEPAPLSKFETVFNSNGNTSFEKGGEFKPGITLKSPKMSNALDKLSYIAWDNKKYLPSANVDFTIPLNK
jgi:hypothetical protein